MSRFTWMTRIPAWLGGAQAKGKLATKAEGPLPLAPLRPALLPEPSVAAYRTAMQQARMGNRRTLLGLYEQAVQDAHLASVMQQRTLATLSRPFVFSGTSGSEMPDAFQGRWFHEFLRLALRAIFYGPGLIQLGPPQPEGGFASASSVPELLLYPDNEEVEAEGGRRIRYSEAPYADWAVPVGSSVEPGLLARAVPLVVAKQQAIAGWNHYLEVFGMPFRLAHTDLRDPAQISRMKEMLSQMGSAGWAVFDLEDKIEFVQMHTGTGSQRGYEELCRFADEQLSKLVLGQTMTTDQGGSLAQAQVHERTGQSVFRADALRIEELVNGELLPRMLRLGMPVAGLRFSFLPDENALPPQLKLDLVKALLPHYRIPPVWLAEEFGIELEPLP